MAAVRAGKERNRKHLMNTFVQQIKENLVRRGPEDPLVRTALKVHARTHGFRVRFAGDKISIVRGPREMILNKSEFVLVPIMMECHDLYFRTINNRPENGREILDFSVPGVHSYKSNGTAFHFPSIPEDDVMDAYTFWYVPQAGDVVWDAGAHAGATTYFLSQLVGSTGRVLAFEPDDIGYSFLLKNIEEHGLANVTPVKKALDRRSGTASFNMDGTMAAAIHDYLTYSPNAHLKSVPTVSFADACLEFGVPSFVKMDIEGAEVAVIEGARDFLTSHPIQFAIESYHLVGGERTYKQLDAIFPKIGYEVFSSNKFGQMFTWARPKSA